MAQSLGPALDSVSPSLSAPPPPILSLSLSLSKINIKKNFKKRRHLTLNMSKTEFLISLSNLPLPSLPYLSKQQLCPSFWYSQKPHQESSFLFFSHTCFQTLSESYRFYLQMYLGSDHCLPPPPSPLWSELPSFLTWMMAIVFQLVSLLLLLPDIQAIFLQSSQSDPFKT